MTSILRQTFVTTAYLGGWLVLSFVLFLCGAPVPLRDVFGQLSGQVERATTMPTISSNQAVPATASVAASSACAKPESQEKPAIPAAAAPATAAAGAELFIAYHPSLWIEAAAPATAVALAADPAETPYLPDPLQTAIPKRIFAVPDVDMSMYFDNVALVLFADRLKCEVDCRHAKSNQPLGRVERRRWTVHPTTADVGEHTLKVVYRDANRKRDGRVLAAAQTTLCVAPCDAGKGESLSMLIVGDSITHMTHWVNSFARLLNRPDNPTWKMVGSNTTPQALPGVRHEGYGGFIWHDFLALYEPGATNRPFRDTSPFVFLNGEKKPALDVPRYIREQCEGRAPDFVFFQLGMNDIFGLPEGQPETACYWIGVILKDAEALIQAWHTAAPKTKLALLVPPQFSVYDLVYAHNYGREYNHWRNRSNHYRYCRLLGEQFSGREEENVFLIPTDMNLDPIDAYPADDVGHPNELGADQYGASVYSWLKWHLATYPSNHSQ